MAHKEGSIPCQHELMLEHLRITLGVTSNRQLLKYIERLKSLGDVARDASRDISEALRRLDEAFVESRPQGHPLHRPAKQVTDKEIIDEYHRLTEHPTVQKWILLHSDVCARAGRPPKEEFDCPACELEEQRKGEENHD